MDTSLKDCTTNRREDCWYRDVCLADVCECENCIRFAEMQYLMETSNLPKAKQQPQLLRTPTNDIKAYKRLSDIKSNIIEFVDNGHQLFITSEITGNGKTSWAIKLLLKYFDEIWAGNGFNVRGLFINVPMFLLKSKDFKNTDPQFEQMKRDILSADLIIWDDIASTTMTNYDNTQLLMYLDARTLEQKANIFTGNITDRNELEKRLGKRLASRVWARDTEVIEFKGGDVR